MAFRVQSRLGRGRVVDTFDAVLEVAGEKLDVVIKRLRPEHRANDALQEALLEWGRTQAELDHPHVVATLEAGRDANGVYIIQERVEGATLARLLTTLRQSRRTLTPANALLIAERVAGATAAIHASPVGHHGDLRPAEVLVGYDGAVKLGDQRLRDLEGLAGLEEPDPDATYRPPEGRVSSAPGDVYALALVIMEMMLGHPVWRSSTMTVADARGAIVDFAPVGLRHPELARALHDALELCLHDDPAQRPAGAGPLLTAITELMNAHHVLREPEALGAFVELVSPPLEDADAPTRMAAAPELADASAGLSGDRKAAFEAASVVLTPEILAQAEAEHHERVRARARSGKQPPPVPRDIDPTARPKPRAPILEGRSRPLEPPRAPSSLRASAAEVPNVAARAAAAAFDRQTSWWPYAAIAAVVVALGAWLMSGEDRTIQLRLTSEPSEAAVYVDEELVGRTPLQRPLQVDSAQLELRFEKPGYDDHRVTIGIEADELRYEAPLKPAGAL